MNSNAERGPTQMLARPFRVDDAERWDAFVTRSANGTFLHSRKFLSYHGDRFEDTSFVIEDQRGRFQAVLPAARDPSNQQQCCSHPGSTFGGLLWPPRCSAHRAEQAFEALLAALRSAGFEHLDYRVTPSIYHKSPVADDIYFLLRSGAQVRRFGLASTIDLQHGRQLSKRRQRTIRQALDQEIEISLGHTHHDPAALAELWPVLRACLEGQHGVAPVHDLKEITELSRRFPSEIRTHVARHKGVCIAGLVCFEHANLCHAQYICASPEGRKRKALDLLLERAIVEATGRGLRFFDFGISTEEGGKVLNHGLDRYKREFGAGSTLYLGYSLKL